MHRPTSKRLGMCAFANTHTTWTPRRRLQLIPIVIINFPFACSRLVIQLTGHSVESFENIEEYRLHQNLNC